MTTMTVGSAAYKAALHRWNELEKAGARGLTQNELDEMETLARALDAAETRTPGPIEAVVDSDDYADEMLRFAGSLGSGVEV